MMIPGPIPWPALPEPPPLAGEGNHFILAALLAMKAAESPGEHAAIQERPKLPFNEPGPVRAALAFLQPAHEGLQVFLQHPIKHRGLGFSPSVDGAR